MPPPPSVPLDCDCLTAYPDHITLDHDLFPVVVGLGTEAFNYGAGYGLTNCTDHDVIMLFAGPGAFEHLGEIVKSEIPSDWKGKRIMHLVHFEAGFRIVRDRGVRSKNLLESFYVLAKNCFFDLKKRKRQDAFDATTMLNSAANCAAAVDEEVLEIIPL